MSHSKPNSVVLNLRTSVNQRSTFAARSSSNVSSFAHGPFLTLNSATHGDASQSGANAIVSPFPSAGSQMAHRMLHPHAAEFVEQLVSRRNPELVLDDIRVGSGSALRGRLVDLRLRERFGVAIIAIRHADGRMETVPGSQASLDTGDVAVVAGSEDAIMTLRSALEGG